MPTFIVDTCADVIEGQKKYIGQFFRDVYKLNDYAIIIGGTKMLGEIKAKTGLLSLINDLRKIGRVETLSVDSVDTKEHEIRDAICARFDNLPSECDDIHLLSLALLSKCQNIISQEQRLSDCVSMVRPAVGHTLCPAIRVIRDEKTYKSLKKQNKL